MDDVTTSKQAEKRLMASPEAVRIEMDSLLRTSEREGVDNVISSLYYFPSVHILWYQPNELGASDWIVFTISGGEQVAGFVLLLEDDGTYTIA